MGVRLRSEKEMRDKIATWIKKDSWAYDTRGSANLFEEVSEEAISDDKTDIMNRVIEQLKKDRFVDDRRFAEEWVSSRMRSKPRGEFLLRMELAQKGIDRFMIEDVLEELLKGQTIEDSEENTVRAMALKVGLKSIRKLNGEDDRAFKFKMSQALARKGFESSTIKSVVDELLVTRYNTQD